VDVYPDGRAYNLTDGVIRARYRDGTAVSLNQPGQPYRFRIDLWATSNVFKKGHVLRLEVSSSNFPRFDRNLNTGEQTSTAQHFVAATNAIYHDAEHPSALILPVVPAQKGGPQIIVHGTRTRIRAYEQCGSDSHWRHFGYARSSAA